MGSELETAPKAGGTDTSVPPLRFRNYIPKDLMLRQFCLPRPSVDELEKQIAKEAEEAIQAAKNEDVLSQVAPRRPNWDLKRDVEKKIAVLSRRTDKAIVHLIREKIMNSKAVEDLNKKERRKEEENDGSKDKLTKEQVEFGHSVMIAMNELEKINEDDDV